MGIQSDRPLDGFTVVSIEQAVAAPYCTRLMADHGARVIKVERPDGGDFARRYDDRVEGEASYFVWANRSKESLCLNLKSPDDMALLWKILEKADVFVQNLAPGAATRLGLSREALETRNPRLVSCGISGFGAGGPYEGRKAYDLLIQAEAGLMSITGTEDTPCKVGLSVADIASGVTAYHLILAALLKRSRTGKGDYIELSMLDALTDWMGHALHYAYDGAPAQVRTGASHATIYPYGPFATAEGIVLFGLQNDREWASFCANVLERPEWAEDARFIGNHGRSSHRTVIEPVINQVFGVLSTAEALERLNTAGIATAEVRDMAGVWTHPQLAAQQRWTDVELPSGKLVSGFIPPSGSWQPQCKPIPALGAHTDAIRSEFNQETNNR